MQLCEGENGVPNREALKSAVAQIMGKDCRGQERKKAKEIGELARKAMEYRSLKAFADKIHELKSAQ